MDGETRSFLNVWLTAIAALCYCYYVTASLPPWKLRVLSLLPVIALFAALPLCISTVIPSGVTAFFLAWLCNSRLLLLAFDSGPLRQHKKSIPLFVTLACLPLNVRSESNRRGAPAARAPKLPFNWAAKILLLAVLVTANGTHCYKDANPKLLVAIYSCMLYLLIDVVLGFFINAVRLLTGVDLEPPSNEPYLSTSLQDFWGRRWNLVVTDTLHQSVYVPLRRAAEPFLGRQWANFPAILATFLVSGLMHELLYYYVIRAYPTWEVTWFFVFHGICVAAEVRIKAAAAARGSRWRIHPAVSGPVAVTFVVVTGSWWFFPPLVRSGVDVRVIEECNAPVKLLWKALEYIGARLNI
ncbi:hypothetical protein SAY86_016122 [Trapa natans]|uniref:Wax synthase domain-containing protein n=1 Tax=Trapa natans TaxID=22666 RepID=A0AAN7LJ10_TRANT|nr:hypothetical protein SAY86_016122 [Trapa natans]